MSDRLFSILTDAKSGPAEKLRALAVQAQANFHASYLEIRMDGIEEIRLGVCPGDAFRIQIGSGGRPVGELAVAPAPAGQCETAELAAFAHCAELIHRLQAGYIDNLTGLYNRRRLDMELSALAVSSDPVAVAMLDIDHFKKVNDTHGHGAGDEVLRQFASHMAAHLPAGGFLSRYGGEEFCVILKNMDEESASSAFERMRGSAASNVIRYGKQEIQITSSAGVACGIGREAQELLGRADQALYSAKEGGRNQLVRAAELSKRAAANLFRRRFQRIHNQPLCDLGWFGQRVIGLDRHQRRLMCVDYFGGVVPVSGSLPDILSFVRIGKKTLFVPADGRGLAVTERGKSSDLLPVSGDGPLPELRRVLYDARMRRLYLIERQGRSVFGTDMGFARPRELRIPENNGSALRGITALLPLGRGLLVLDALGRNIHVLDRDRLTPKQTWSLPESGYEICLCYLPSLKLVMAGGADGMKLFSLDGQLVEESSQPVISAYAHPLIGLVLSTPEETVLVR